VFEVNQLINQMCLFFTYRKHLEISEEANVISTVYSIGIQNWLIRHDQMQHITCLRSIRIIALGENKEK